MQNGKDINQEQTKQAFVRDEGQIGSAGIGSDRLEQTRMRLHHRLIQIDHEKQQLLAALKDTEDPAVQKVFRIMSLA